MCPGPGVRRPLTALLLLCGAGLQISLRQAAIRRPCSARRLEHALVCHASGSTRTATSKADSARSRQSAPVSPALKQAGVWGIGNSPIAVRPTYKIRQSSRTCTRWLVGLRSHTRSARRLVPEAMSGINSRPAPPVRSYSPGPPNTSNNFLKEQISKQQRSNFHSTSLNKVVTMAAHSVNKTALHPSGVEHVKPTIHLYVRC